jgi:hypothetical protein
MEHLVVTLNGYGKLTLPHDDVRQPGYPTEGAIVASYVTL